MDEEKSQAMEATKNVIEITKDLTEDDIHNAYDKVDVVSDATHNFANINKDKVDCRTRKVSSCLCIHPLKFYLYIF